MATSTRYVDDTAERNDAFYNADPKIKVMYPKKLIYPPEGGEYCLEELRAIHYHCNVDDDDDNGMEMTEVIHQGITTNIPVIQVGGKAQLQPIGGVKRAVGVGRKPLGQLQPVDEELEELEQMLDNKAPVVLKTENSFGVSNFSYKSDHGDSLCCDVSSFHKKLNFSDAESTGNISNFQNSMSHSNIQHSIPHSMKSYSLRESLSHSRHAHKVYPKTPAVAKSSNGKLSSKSNLFDDVDDDESQLSHHSTAAHLLEQDLMNDSPDASSWEVYQSECGSISQHSNHSVDTTGGRTVAEEESFDVYCDSSAVTEGSLSHLSLSKNHNSSLLSSKENRTNCRTGEVKGWREKKRDSIQLDPIPMPPEHTSRFQLSLLDDQSTQFDIPRPAIYDDHTSTPYPYQSVSSPIATANATTTVVKTSLDDDHVKSNQSKVTSTSAATTAKTRSRPQQTPWNLSLISEESDVKSSSSSCDSASSCTSSKKVWLKEEGLLVQNREELPNEINPYDANIVEYMCNNVSGNVRPIGVLENSFDSLLITDSTIKLGGHSYLIKKLIGSGAFANIYLAIDIHSGDKKALKVQSPACPWEYYISEELRCRLLQQGEGQEMKAAREQFMMIEDGYMSERCSVLVTGYEALGTMLDLINMIKTGRRQYSIEESIAAFYAVELINMVCRLHQCHVIHGDIKPDNIMIMDIRRNSRCAIKLIDFGRSIDMRSFDSSTQFTGSCNTSGFVCTEMKTGKPWSWQVDYYAVAATIYCLIHGNYMEVIRMPGAGYKPRRNPPKFYNATMTWNKMFTQLLNTDHLQPPSAPLDQLANQLSKLVTTNVTSSINSLLDRMVH